MKQGFNLIEMFVREGNRLQSEGLLLQAIISLKNACYCRNIRPEYQTTLDEIIEDMSREFRFGNKRV